MKTYKLLALIIAFFCIQTVAAQDDMRPRVKSRMYKLKVAYTDGSTYKGWYQGISEDSIRVSADKAGRSLRAIHYSFIKTLKFRKSSAVRSGLIIGASTGLATGLAIGAVERKNWERDSRDEITGGILMLLTEKPKPGYYALIFAPVGAGIGAAIGALSGRKFLVDGNKEKFSKVATSKFAASK